MNDVITTCSPEETQAYAAQMLADRPARTVFALYGNLGSGKTCFVKGLGQALGIETIITSPTFTLINEHHGSKPLFHVDLYRLNDPIEAVNIGLEEYMKQDAVVAIEWAERAEELLPEDCVRLKFEVNEETDQRTITVLPRHPPQAND